MKNSKKSLSKAAFIALFLVFAGLILCAGCASEEKTPNPAKMTSQISYSVSDEGVLIPEKISYSFSLANVTNAGGNSTVKLSEIWMDGGEAAVYSLLASPENPKAGIVFAPGAGVSADAHKKRSVDYAESDIAFMAVDIRGNGGKTPGLPLDFSNELRMAVSGLTPQYYMIVFDIIAAKDYLKEIYGESFPVYAMGSSNGGRYAAVAAGCDSEFAGYFGVSTSGYFWENGISSKEADLFIKSINPDTYIGNISPAKTVIFHSPDDTVIEYDDGFALYEKASEPKMFVSFNGTHGINGEADRYIKNLLAED